MFRFAVAVTALCAAVVAALALAAREPSPAVACVGGIRPLEDLASSEMILLGDAVEVGGAANAAPTLTPTSTPSHTPTATPTRSPAALTATPTVPPQPSPPTPPTVPVPHLDLRGVGVTLQVVRAYAGTPGERLPLEWETRAAIERQLRTIQAGASYISDCALGAFVPRFVAGQRYLVFVQRYDNSLFAAGVFPVAGDHVVLGDPLLRPANQDDFYMKPTTYRRFFAGTSADVSPYMAFITATRVPLSSVLRAIAALRGDVSIAPPETGSAGLAARR